MILGSIRFKGGEDGFFCITHYENVIVVIEVGDNLLGSLWLAWLGLKTMSDMRTAYHNADTRKMLANFLGEVSGNRGLTGSDADTNSRELMRFQFFDGFLDIIFNPGKVYNNTLFADVFNGCSYVQQAQRHESFLIRQKR